MRSERNSSSGLIDEIRWTPIRIRPAHSASRLLPPDGVGAPIDDRNFLAHRYLLYLLPRKKRGGPTVDPNEISRPQAANQATKFSVANRLRTSAFPDKPNQTANTLCKC